ncbi:WD repeat domain phosphoinositide-interacting protein 4, partial [Caerostris darwini]
QEEGCINNLSFNQDHGCFSCAMDNGVKIYNVEPLRQLMHLDTATVGSVAICEMLYRTNIIAMVGGGRKQKYAENTVLLWDNIKNMFVTEFVCSSPVLAVKMQRDRVFIAVRTEIHVFSFPGSEHITSFPTGINNKGLMQVSPFPSSERQVLVFPGHYSGSIQIVDLQRMKSHTRAAPIIINAHDSEIAYISLNQDGTRIATASIKGTLIRIFDTFSKTKVIELRRGSDNAALYCINFSLNSDYLCASSDKGTIHIFALKHSHLNKRLKISPALSLIQMGYGDSQWALATFKSIDEDDSKCICAFGPNSSIYAISEGENIRVLYTKVFNAVKCIT